MLPKQPPDLGVCGGGGRVEEGESVCRKKFLSNGDLLNLQLIKGQKPWLQTVAFSSRSAPN